MKRTLQVINWDKWQSYRKDRGQPPWIKVHRCLMRNPEWVSLTDAERGQLVCIWLLAADHDGRVPEDAMLIKRLCFLRSKPNLKKFIQLEFLTSTRRQLDVPKAEESREEESREEDARAQANGHFDVFWKAYPRKVGKPKASDSFHKKVPASDFDTLMASLEGWKKCEQWQDINYVPHPSTWLNREGWKDEPPPPRTRASPQQHNNTKDRAEEINSILGKRK